MSGEQQWRVVVGADCIGSGVCLSLASHRFVMDDDMRTRPVTELVRPEDAVLDAAASCPMEAIGVTDADTGKRIDW